MKKRMLFIVAMIVLLTTVSSGIAAAGGGYMPWLYRQLVNPVTVIEPLAITATGGFVNPATTLFPGEVVLSTTFEVENKGSLQYGVLPLATYQEPPPQGPYPYFVIRASVSGKARLTQAYDGQTIPISAGEKLTIVVEVRVAYDSVPGSAKIALEIRRVEPPPPPRGELG